MQRLLVELLDENALWAALTLLLLLLSWRVLSSAANGGAKGSQVTFPVHMKQADGPKDEHDHAPFEYERLPEDEMAARAIGFHELLKSRRSIRFFSTDAVPLHIVSTCVAAGATAPSGAHCQPWQFLVVQTASIKQKIREAVEEQERINYEKRMKTDWVDAVTPMIKKIHDNGIAKPYLTEAPFLVILMKESYKIGPEGERIEHYYPEQSVGIAAGMFLSAITAAGLVSLPSTPMGAESFIRQLLGREENEKVYLLLPVGYPASDATVPYRDPKAAHRALGEVLTVY
jgi:iodotyrosine deiodinase